MLPLQFGYASQIFSHQLPKKSHHNICSMIIYIHFVFQIYSYQGSFTIYRVANSKNNTDFYFGDMGNFGPYFIFAYIFRPTCSIKLTKQENKKVHFFVICCKISFNSFRLKFINIYCFFSFNLTNSDGKNLTVIPDEVSYDISELE